MGTPDKRATNAAAAASDQRAEAGPPRRALLRKLARFAAVTPPAVILLLSLRAKPARAVVSKVSSRQFKEPVTLPSSRRLS